MAVYGSLTWLERFHEHITRWCWSPDFARAQPSSHNPLGPAAVKILRMRSFPVSPQAFSGENPAPWAYMGHPRGLSESTSISRIGVGLPTSHGLSPLPITHWDLRIRKFSGCGPFRSHCRPFPVKIPLHGRMGQPRDVSDSTRKPRVGVGLPTSH